MQIGRKEVGSMRLSKESENADEAILLSTITQKCELVCLEEGKLDAAGRGYFKSVRMCVSGKTRRANVKNEGPGMNVD